jgi:hypothetical protein
MAVDATARLNDARGLPLLRLGGTVVHKEIQDGKWVVLTVQIEDGRRLLLNIRAEVLEEIAPPARAA